MTFCFAILITFVIFVLFKIYLKLTTGWCKSQTCLINKTAIITGANSGIGFETALDFAKRGARVILACRNEQKAEEARKKIIEETGNENIVVKTLDMSSFQSVRDFAKEINDKEDRLDILVNNAGIFGSSVKLSRDGLPLTIQTNHFSGFLLTNLLINLLKKSGPSRIVNVSSLAARSAYNFDISNILKDNSPRIDYRYSKLCNILFTQELAKKLKGTQVTTYSLHPGLVQTNIFEGMEGFTKAIFTIAVNLFSKTAEEGAQTTIYCSVAKEIENLSGEFFSDCKRREPYETARDTGLAKKLWEKSEEVVQLKRDEIQI